MTFPVLFEDEAMVVIDKPPGVVVNRAESVKTKTVEDWAREFNPTLERAGIVHRLDKETSGILLIAKTPFAFEHLQGQFKDRTVKKTYLAIVHGTPVPSEGTINAPVGRLPWNRERFGVTPDGKEAVTRYKVVTPGEHSVVELSPKSGRTHQIRVHLKYIGHPVVGDYLYAGRKTARDDRLSVQRVMLHAWKLSCAHPVSGRALAFEAPIPDDMRRATHGQR